MKNILIVKFRDQNSIFLIIIIIIIVRGKGQTTWICAYDRPMAQFEDSG